MKQANDFLHQPGFHCGSTSVQAMLRHFGTPVSEPMVLGLSQVLYMSYWEGASLSPTKVILPRAPEMEIVALEAFGFGVLMRQSDHPERAWQRVLDRLSAGEPAMLQVDIRDLPYYNTKTRFAGHKIVVYGVDQAKGTVLISDSEFEKPQKISIEQLAKARVSSQPPFDLRHNDFEITQPKKLTPFEVAIPIALVGQAKLLLGGPEYFGLTAYDFMAARITGWAKAKDWKWCARFAYQIIEKRGTGGGAFRKKYVEFLKEAIPYCPQIQTQGLVEMIERSAAQWTEMAGMFRKISDQETPDGLDQLVPFIRKLKAVEQEFCDSVLGSTLAG